VTGSKVIAYNTTVVAGAWANRTTADVCIAVINTTTSYEVWYAVSAGAGVAPVWVQKYKLNLVTGLIDVGGGGMQMIDILSQAVTATGIVKTIVVGKSGQLMCSYKENLFGGLSGSSCTIQLYKNGVAVGTSKNYSAGSSVTTQGVFSEIIAGWAIGDIATLQVTALSLSALGLGTLNISDFCISG